MPVFPKYYNPQLDENDYRRNMMRVFRIEKNQDNNTDYTSSSSSGTSSNPQSLVGKHVENLDSEMLSFDEKITVLQNTLNEVDDDMTTYKSFYDSEEFTSAVIPPGHHHIPGEKYINTHNTAALQRVHKLSS